LQLIMHAILCCVENFHMDYGASSASHLVTGSSHPGTLTAGCCSCVGWLSMVDSITAPNAFRFK
jgi:hypothetical protein